MSFSLWEWVHGVRGHGRLLAANAGGGPPSVRRSGPRWIGVLRYCELDERETRMRAVGDRRGRLAPDDGGCLMNQRVVLKRRQHEEREVHAARAVARKDGVADVAAPHGQALALPLGEVTPPHDRPPRATGEHPAAGFHLVVEVGEARETRESAE